MKCGLRDNLFMNARQSIPLSLQTLLLLVGSPIFTTLTVFVTGGRGLLYFSR
jgi:hypothetical protein